MPEISTDHIGIAEKSLSVEIPLVSVCMITYNHENYVRQAIESVLSQQADFAIELVISDDGSTDETGQVCRDFEKKNLQIVRYIKNDSNIGMMPNFIKALQLCKGKYIALCEGDDYWINDYKLKKCVQALDEHPEYTLCCHENYKLISGKISIDNILKISAPGRYTLEDYLLQPFFHTSSMVFRRVDLIPHIPDWYKNVFAGDNFLVAILGSQGDIYYLNECMSVYRVHAASISNKYGILNMKENYLKHMNLFNQMNNFKYDDIIKKLTRKWELITFCYDEKYGRKLKYFLKNISGIWRVYASPQIKMSLFIRYIVPTKFVK